MKQYDVIVVGAGHAGIEAALAAKRMGASVLVLTIHLDMIGHMPCNPAVGGIAKSHLVFEIDALGGEIGFATDKTGIQFKMLNRKKGPSVWSLRAQVDRADYRSYMKKKIMESVDVKQGEVVEILTEGDRVIGVKTKTGTEYYSKTVILTTGTFMQGLVHIGMVRFSAGRLGEPPSTGLSDSLKKLGFELGRLKTGTSARADGRTIDFSTMEIQPGDENPEHFSHRTVEFNPPQIPCYLTHTTPETHEIIRKNIALAPLYAGVIKGIGPRYCPSLEDKVMKFPERGKHHVFVEPDGRDTNEYYLNGVSSSLPEEIQLKFMRTIPGLEQVEFLRPGYAIEYDFVFPTQLRHSLETKKIQGLFLAGQINGTSGYEEAAAQGIMAGINAVLKIRGEEPFVLRRDEAYIGVLIDDLVTRGTKEPYRMFTSRAEYRLILRQDNADERLARYGVKYGLVDKTLLEKVEERRKRVDELLKKMKRIVVSPGKINISKPASLFHILKMPEFHFEDIHKFLDEEVPHDVSFRVEIEAKYDGYIQRAIAHAKKLKEMERVKIPEDIDYSKIRTITMEAREKLSRERPETLGEASRISGVSPSDIFALYVYIKRKEEE